MKELSVFIDESGDFGEITERPAYYLVTMLFHDQKNEITSNIKKLEESTKNSGFELEYIHTGPVIFICSMELLKIKKNENRLSKSENQFFYKPQELKKTFFKAVDKKQLEK